MDGVHAAAVLSVKLWILSLRLCLGCVDVTAVIHI